MNQYMVQEVILNTDRKIVERRDMRGPFTAATPDEAASEYGQEILEEGEELPAAVELRTVYDGSVTVTGEGQLFIFGVKVHAQPL